MVNFVFFLFSVRFAYLVYNNHNHFCFMFSLSYFSEVISFFIL